jgi:uncharacterized protein (DUF362 family)
MLERNAPNGRGVSDDGGSILINHDAGMNPRSSSTRREFLRATFAAGSALALGFPTGTAAAEGDPKMCIARWTGLAATNPDQIKAVATKLAERSISDLGGMARFVKSGDGVWIKPNIGFPLAPEFAVNTNPDLVATLVRLCRDAGARTVKVGDNSCYGAQRAYPESGIEAAVKAAGGEMLLFEESRFREVKLDGERLEKWPLYGDLLDADLLINVPIVKQHPLTGVTACMKNYMGVAGGPRDLWHKEIIPCLCDVTAYMKPRLCVVDAVRILTANGPTGGELDDVKFTGLVAAGVDVVALDAFAAELIGLNPAQSKMMAAAEKRGLGNRDYRKSALRAVEVL